MYGALDVAVSGMIAQRQRMEVATANLTNAGAYKFGAGGEPIPYQRRIALLAPGDPSAETRAGQCMGVHLAGIGIDQSPPELRDYDPGNPHAYKSGPNKGWVPVSSINPLIEQANFLEAQRAYEASEVAAENTKTMMAQALRLLA